MCVLRSCVRLSVHPEIFFLSLFLMNEENKQLNKRPQLIYLHCEVVDEEADVSRLQGEDDKKADGYEAQRVMQGPLYISSQATFTHVQLSNICSY